MHTRLLDRELVPALPCVGTSTSPARATPDAGFDALARLTKLRDRLQGACTSNARSRWKEPPVFSFDRLRQAEYEAARAAAATAESHHELCDSIASELPLLFASVEVRRVARVIDGLRAAAKSLAPTNRTAKDLAELLEVPDDEVVLALFPERRAGYRFSVRGVADIGQLHILMADALAGDPSAGPFPAPAIPARFVAACRDVNPATPGGIPMVAHARWQLYSSAVLGRHGSLPAGIEGCSQWLWPSLPLAAIPRIEGERVVLLGPPAFAATWEVTRRFPEMPAELRLIESLSPFRVGERLLRMSGMDGAPAIHAEAPGVFSKAA